MRSKSRGCYPGDLAKRADGGAGSQTLGTNISNVSEAIGETNRSATNVLGASDAVSTAAERLEHEVQQFFVMLRSGKEQVRKAA